MSDGPSPVPVAGLQAAKYEGDFNKPEELFDALRKVRQRMGLCLGDPEERSGIDRATLPKLETGALANPTLQTVIRRRQPSVPKKPAEVIDRALQERPDIGFQTAAEFRKALEDATA